MPRGLIVTMGLVGRDAIIERHQHGRHTYKPEDYGLERGSVERAFAAYIINFAEHAR